MSQSYYDHRYMSQNHVKKFSHSGLIKKNNLIYYQINLSQTQLIH